MEEGIQKLALMFVPFLLAVVFHEYAHGLVALKWGDNTAKAAGRLTLNPAPHIDPIGTLLLPGLMMMMPGGLLFGWAKPVPINPTRFTKYRPGLFWVSFAGPLMNFLLALISAAVFCAILKFVSPHFSLYSPLLEIARISVLINFFLGIFNLIPLPPLDGSKMLQSYLSYEATQKYEALAQYSFWILLALLLTGTLRYLAIPVFFAYNATLKLMMALFGIQPF